MLCTLRGSLLQARGQGGIVLLLLDGFLFRREHTMHDRSVQLVGHIDNLTLIVHLPNREGRQVTFLIEDLMSNLYR